MKKLILFTLVMCLASFGLAATPTYTPTVTATPMPLHYNTYTQKSLLVDSSGNPYTASGGGGGGTASAVSLVAAGAIVGSSNPLPVAVSTPILINSTTPVNVNIQNQTLDYGSGAVGANTQRIVPATGSAMFVTPSVGTTAGSPSYVSTVGSVYVQPTSGFTWTVSIPGTVQANISSAPAQSVTVTAWTATQNIGVTIAASVAIPVTIAASIGLPVTITAVVPFIGCTIVAQSQAITVNNPTAANLQVTALLAAGSALAGKVGIDQTTVGTTNAVSLAQVGATTVVTGGVNGTLGVGGTTASGATEAGNPVSMGLLANTSAATVAAGQRERWQGSLAGEGYVMPYQPSNSTLNSAATTNATSVKASAGTLTSLLVTNQVAAPRYLKLYNKASAPTVGTDSPVATIAIPGTATASAQGTTVNFAQLDVPLPFATGIAFAITGLPSDADTTAVAAGDVKVYLNYK